MEDVSLPEVSLWSRARVTFGIWIHIMRWSQAIGVRLRGSQDFQAVPVGLLGAYLRAGSLPKKVTKVMKEMPQTARATVESVPIVKAALPTPAFSSCPGVDEGPIALPGSERQRNAHCARSDGPTNARPGTTVKNRKEWKYLAPGTFPKRGDNT